MANNTETLLTTLAGVLSNKSNIKPCSGNFFLSKCYLMVYGPAFAYLLFAFALLPQIIHLFNSRIRYIAGISYIWIILRILASTSLILAHDFKWSSMLQLIALICAIIIFLQILIFSNYLHRQNKITLILVSLAIWALGRVIIFFLIKNKSSLITIGYVLLAMEMLPQILLNSLLRTTKAFSRMTLFLLAMSYLILFYSFIFHRTRLIYLIPIYYSLSFILYLCLQNLVYSDAHIHLISRSAHTVLTPGVDVFTGLDINGIRSTGQDPQMFAGDEIEMDGIDVVYQPVTTNKSPIVTMEQSPMRIYLWYIMLGCIFVLEMTITVTLIYRARSPWIIFAPISIVFILGSFHLIRTRLNAFKTENLRKIL